MFVHFARLSPCAKTQNVMLNALFGGTNSCNRQAEDQPEVGFKKNNFYLL